MSNQLGNFFTTEVKFSHRPLTTQLHETVSVGPRQSETPLERFRRVKY